MPTQKQKILILDGVHEICQRLLAAEGFSVTQEPPQPADKLEPKIGRYSAVVVRSVTKLNAALLRAGAKGALRLVVRAGAGTDNISVPDATRLGVIVENTPGTNAQAVIEHTIGALILMARNIIPAHNTLKAGKWEKKAFEGAELHGRTLGIIGLGRIGRGVAAIGQAMGMRVIGYDPVVSKDKAQELGVEIQPPEKVFEQADFIALHAALTDQSRCMVNEKAFARMKPGVCIANCARAELVDKSALLKALDSGKVKYYFTDVFELEPPQNDPVLQHPRVLVTPHLAGSTEESGIEGARMAAQQIIAYFRDDRIVNAVNFAPGDPSLKPWESLADKLGSFAYQYLADGGFKRVTITYNGKIASLDTNRVTCSFYTGFMRNVSDSVNIVNAKSIAAERGITMAEARGAGQTEGMVVSVLCGDGEVALSGACVLGKPILQKVDDYTFDIPLVEKHFLVSLHSDVPGIVGIIGTVLGANRINIEKMGLQDITGRPAMAVITTREEVPESAIAQIAAAVKKKKGGIVLKRIRL
jgi:D-3-phosphoglycerate dehydrogenase